MKYLAMYVSFGRCKEFKSEWYKKPSFYKEFVKYTIVYTILAPLVLTIYLPSHIIIKLGRFLDKFWRIKWNIWEVRIGYLNR